jgi:hypothetical protein
MKFLVQLILTIILAFILVQFLPFWGMAVAAFFVAILFNHSSWGSFLAGFLGIALFWTISAWIFSDANNNIMLERVAGIFKLTPMALLFVMFLMGGLLGGFAAASGSHLHRIVFRRKRRRANPYWR